MPFCKKDPTSGELLTGTVVHGGHYMLTPKDTTKAVDGWAWYATEAEGLEKTGATPPAGSETVEALKEEVAELKKQVTDLTAALSVATDAAVGK